MDLFYSVCLTFHLHNRNSKMDTSLLSLPHIDVQIDTDVNTSVPKFSRKRDGKDIWKFLPRLNSLYRVLEIPDGLNQV